MNPSDNAKKLATFIDSKYQDSVSKNISITIEEIAGWIEDSYGDSLVSRLRRKMKNQKKQLMQLQRAHVTLVHEAADWVKEKMKRKAADRKEEIDPVLTTIPEGAPTPIISGRDNESIRLERMGF